MAKSTILTEISSSTPLSLRWGDSREEASLYLKRMECPKCKVLLVRVKNSESFSTKAPKKDSTQINHEQKSICPSCGKHFIEVYTIEVHNPVVLAEDFLAK